MRVVVHEFTSLDDVVQGPGGPDEDTSGGFRLGGWTAPFGGGDVGDIVNGWFARASAVLFGRVTYEMMAAYWPRVTDPDDPVATRLNSVPKYVVSRTMAAAEWPTTTILRGDPVAAVHDLSSLGEGELQVHGSHALVQTLQGAGLVDEYRLLRFPVVLGSGKRLFEPGSRPMGFTVVESRITGAGGVYQVLRPAPLVVGVESMVRDGRERGRRPGG